MATITVENEHQTGYDRSLFDYGIDADGDGCDTRAEVLIRDSLTPAQGCPVATGQWYSTYDNLTWADPSQVQVDHVVALKEAWDSGAWEWDTTRRRAFGNDLEDLRTLRAVSTSMNLSKGQADPSNWIPPYAPAVCTYLADWTSIKARWSLSMDQSEHGRIRNLLTDRCPEQLVAPWPDTPPPTPPPSSCDPSYPTVCIPPKPPD